MTKAGALLRHLDAASRPEEPHAAAHKTLLKILVGMMVHEAPPPTAGGGELEALKEWAAASRLLAAAGPLLAAPSASARRSLRDDAARLLGAKVLAEWDLSAEGEQDDGAAAAGPSVAQSAAGPSTKKRKKIGPKVDSAAGPSYDFYNDAIPMDVFMGAQDLTERTADGVPVMDLLSSEDEAPAPPRPAAPPPAPAARSALLAPVDLGEAPQAPGVAGRGATGGGDSADGGSGHWL